MVNKNKVGLLGDNDIGLSGLCDYEIFKLIDRNPYCNSCECYANIYLDHISYKRIMNRIENRELIEQKEKAASEQVNALYKNGRITL